MMLHWSSATGDIARFDVDVARELPESFCVDTIPADYPFDERCAKLSRAVSTRVGELNNYAGARTLPDSADRGHRLSYHP